MGQAVSLLPNALGRPDGPVDAHRMRKLEVLASQDGLLESNEVSYLKGLRATPQAKIALADFLNVSATRGVQNPEITALKAKDPTFAAKVKALETHAKPGDLIFWKSAEKAQPWGIMSSAYGPYMHVSVVLADGKLMDPYWPDGVTIATKESAVAKSFTRIKASDMVIGRPSTPLTSAQLKQLTTAAYAAQGKPYALLAPMSKPAEGSSCSRTAYDLFKGVGVDLAPASQRMYHSVITPGDLIQNAVAHIDANGAVHLTPPADFVPARPKGPIAMFLGWADALGHRFEGLMAPVYKAQEPVTAALMNKMIEGHFSFRL